MEIDEKDLDNLHQFIEPLPVPTSDVHNTDAKITSHPDQEMAVEEEKEHFDQRPS